MAREKKTNSDMGVIEQIFDYADEETRQRLKYYRDKINIFPDKFIFVENDPNSDANYRSQTSQYSKEAFTMIKNVFILDSFFTGPKKVKDIMHKQIKKDDLEKQIDIEEQKFIKKYEAYRYWLYNLPKLKKLLLSDDVDFENQDIEDLLTKKNKSTEELSEPYFLYNKKSSRLLSLYTAKLIESIEKKAVFKEENIDDMAEKAIYYLQLGAVSIAKDMLNYIIKKYPEHGKAWYILGLIYLKKASEDSKNAFNNYFRMEDSGYKYEAHFEQSMHMDLDDCEKNQSEAFKMLLMAYVNWPKQSKHGGVSSYENSHFRKDAIQTLLNMAFKKIRINDEKQFSENLKRCIERQGFSTDEIHEKKEYYYTKEIDHLLLKILYDSKHYMFNESSMFNELIFMHLYYFLDRKHYEDKKTDWIKNLSKELPKNIFPFFRETIPHYNDHYFPVQTVFTDHLSRNVPIENQIKMLNAWEKTYVEDIQHEFARIRIQRYTEVAVKFYGTEKQNKNFFLNMDISDSKTTDPFEIKTYADFGKTSKNYYHKALNVIKAALNNLEDDFEIRRKYCQNNPMLCQGIHKRDSYLKFLYMLVRVSYDISKSCLENNDIEKAIDILFEPLSYQKHLIRFFSEINENDYMIVEDYGTQDFFGNYENIIYDDEIMIHTETIPPKPDYFEIPSVPVPYFDVSDGDIKTSQDETVHRIEIVHIGRLFCEIYQFKDKLSVEYQEKLDELWRQLI